MATVTVISHRNQVCVIDCHRNQVTVITTPNGLNQIGNVGAATVTHDSKGNITGVGSDSYGYSSENFLTSGPGSATLGYDPMGRLYQVAQGSSTTRMGYDRLDRIAEYDSSNAIQRRYIHGPGIDSPIAWYEGSGLSDRRYLSSDERGSVISVTGGTTTLNKYDEYGVPQTGNSGKFGYTGQAWVPEIGLWYYKARFMRPDIGRFMQTDPIGYGAGPNLYAYVLNDPVNWVDPLGLWLQCVQWARVTVQEDGGSGGGGSWSCVRWRENGLPSVFVPVRGPVWIAPPAPPAPKEKKLKQCVVDFLNKNAPGYDWSKVRITNEPPVGGAPASTGPDTIYAGENFGTIGGSLLFHELGHMPQWASGELTPAKYAAAIVGATFKTIHGMVPIKHLNFSGIRSAVHGTIPFEAKADTFMTDMIRAWGEQKPCG